MPRRGMVHALNNAWRVLADGGLLVDLHPALVRPVIFCETPGGRVRVGLIRGERSRYRNAEISLARVVRQGAFRLRHSEVFRFLHYAPSLRALHRFIEEDWNDAWVNKATERRIQALLGQKAIGTLIIAEWVRISVLEKV